MNRRRLIAAAFALVCATQSFCQEQRGQTTLEIPLVLLDGNVPVSDLQINVGNTPIREFRGVPLDGRPIQLVIAVDLSLLSLKRDLINQAKPFIKELLGHQRTSIAVVGYQQKAGLIANFSRDLSLLEKAIDDLPPTGMSDLTKGAKSLALLLKNKPVNSRVMVLLIGAGEDLGGKISEDVIADFQRIRCPVITVTVLDYGTANSASSQGAALQRLAEQTGGSFLMGDTVRRMQDALSEAAQLLKRYQVIELSLDGRLLKQNGVGLQIRPISSKGKISVQRRLFPPAMN